jgi:hypothetical protein
MHPRDLATIRRHHPFRTAADALAVAKSVRKADIRGSATFVLVDDDRRIVDLICVDDGGEHLAELVELLCRVDDDEATGLFIVTDRTGEVPADRPDDELVWMELVDIAACGGVTLLDWFVVWGRKAFSVAEFAPIPPQWTGTAPAA